MNYEDAQRTSNVADEDLIEKLPKKQEEFKRILQDLGSASQRDRLFNYYVKWPRAYSVSEKLLAYGILFILKYDVILNEDLKWDDIVSSGNKSDRRAKEKILVDVKGMFAMSKDVSSEIAELRTKLTIVRYIRLAQLFIIEERRGDAALSVAKILETSSSEEEAEEDIEINYD